MKVIRMVVSLTIFATLAGPALAQQKPKPGASATVVYKCVDGRGKVYYSDKLTPECNEIEEMNRQGRVVKKHETLKPGVAPKPAADGMGGAKDSAERQRRDRALTATYTSEQEIDFARDRSLEGERLAQINRFEFALEGPPGGPTRFTIQL